MVPAPTRSRVRVPAMSVGFDEQHHSAEAEREPENHVSGRSPAVGPQPVDQRHPERHHRDQQGPDSGRYVLQRPTDAPVAAGRHQHADEPGGQPGRSRSACAARPRVRPTPRRTSPALRKAPAGHQERRDFRHAPADGQVGRSPDDVDRRKGGHERDARRGGMDHGESATSEQGEAGRALRRPGSVASGASAPMGSVSTCVRAGSFRSTASSSHAGLPVLPPLLTLIE